LSYYLFWRKKDYTETIVDLENNLIDMAAKYNKEVMIVEVGG
jgi:arabinogalactan endo-1,4-beta-galactosidase